MKLGLTVLFFAIALFLSGCVDEPAKSGDNNPVINPNTGCPPDTEFACSGWILAPECNIKSCSCFYSGSAGDVAVSYYLTSDNQYFPCSGTGSEISCMAAAQQADQACGQQPQ
jgi:hypothetical protein